MTVNHKLRLPKSVFVKCPHCGKKGKIPIEVNKSYHKVECPKCKTDIHSPRMQCCVICAFSNKKCPGTMIYEHEFKKFKDKKNE
jgi:hypothetical protein